MRRLFVLIFGVAAVTLSACAFAAKPVVAPTEKPPTFRASDLLPASIVRTKDYTIDERVPVEDYLYSFRIETRFGVIPAHGMEMLKVRLQEMRCLSRAEQIRKNSTLLKSAWKSFEKTGRGVKTIVTNPDGVILNAPRGLFKFLRRTIDDINILDERKDKSGGDMRRQLAAELGVDPETSNPVLKKFLDEASTKREIVDLIVQNGMDVVLPGFSVPGMTEDVRYVLVSESPKELADRMNKQLKRMGVSKKIRKKFFAHPCYTSQMRYSIVYNIQTLRRAKDPQAMFEACIQATSEAEALCYARMAEMLKEINHRQTIRELDQFQGLPYATVLDGSIIMPVCVDYVYCSEEVREGIIELGKVKSETPFTIWLTGKASDITKALLKRNDLKLVEGYGAFGP